MPNGRQTPEYRKQYKLLNKDKIRAQMKEYYIRTRDERVRVRKDYAERNKEKIRLYKLNRRHTDVQVKLAHTFRSRYKKFLKQVKTSNTCLTILGCSLQEWRNHLESKFKPGMSWETYGHKGWHVDHIRPIASYDLTKDEEVRKAFHFTNTQPLWWQENLSKGDKV